MWLLDLFILKISKTSDKNIFYLFSPLMSRDERKSLGISKILLSYIWRTQRTRATPSRDIGGQYFNINEFDAKQTLKSWPHWLIALLVAVITGFTNLVRMIPPDNYVHSNTETFVGNHLLGFWIVPIGTIVLYFLTPFLINIRIRRLALIMKSFEVNSFDSYSPVSNLLQRLRETYPKLPLLNRVKMKNDFDFLVYSSFLVLTSKQKDELLTKAVELKLKLLKAEMDQIIKINREAKKVKLFNFAPREISSGDFHWNTEKIVAHLMEEKDGSGKVAGMIEAMTPELLNSIYGVEDSQVVLSGIQSVDDFGF